MKHELSFDTAHDYSASDAISVPVTLRSADAQIEFIAFVDTGSTFCIFERGRGEALGPDVEAGSPARISAATGGFDVYGHTLALETLGYSFDVPVYFAAHEGSRRNVLGRRGWLDAAGSTRCGSGWSSTKASCTSASMTIGRRTTELFGGERRGRARRRGR